MKILNLICVGALMLLSALAMTTEASEGKVGIFTEEETITNLFEKGVIPSEQYYEFVDRGFHPDQMIVEVTYSRATSVLVTQLSSARTIMSTNGGPANPEDGDEQEYRYDRVENGNLYRYNEVHRYQSGGWILIHYSKTMIGPAPGEPGENDPE